MSSPGITCLIVLAAFLTHLTPLLLAWRCKNKYADAVKHVLYLQYVDDLLATIVSFRPELQEILQQLQDQVHLTAQASQAEAAKFTGTTKVASAGRKQTVPKPFNLTQPKPKLQPSEEPLPAPVKYVLHTCLLTKCTQNTDTKHIDWSCAY